MPGGAAASSGPSRWCCRCWFDRGRLSASPSSAWNHFLNIRAVPQLPGGQAGRSTVEDAPSSSGRTASTGHITWAVISPLMPVLSSSPSGVIRSGFSAGAVKER